MRMFGEYTYVRGEKYIYMINIRRIIDRAIDIIYQYQNPLGPTLKALIPENCRPES